MKTEWALITGASTGLGKELAWVFAQHHFNLVLVARDEARLTALAGELRARHSIQTQVLAADLALPGAAAGLFEALRPTPISVLVNNAGLGFYGPFATAPLAEQSRLIQLNLVALVELTHLFAQPMLERGAGRILNVASIAAFQPGPTVNVYYATKAFVYSFSYALAAELAPRGIRVTVLCPGATRTEFFSRAKLPMHESGLMEARPVALAAYRGLMRGHRVVVPGRLNRLVAALSPCLPSRLSAGIVQWLHRQR